MKEKFKYILTIIITLIVGVIGTIVTLKHYDLLGKPVIEKTVSNITLTESDTIKPAIDKVYDSQVYIESYKNNRQTGSGSGFVYKKDDKYGYILTNHHVIDGASSIQTTNMQGQTVTAKVLGSDEYTDVAVLRVEASAVLSVAELGKSENSNIGDTIFAVGSPMGKEYIGSVTKGIISGKNRSVTVNSTNNPSTQYVVEVIQVDAALNPGNSGGALVNINGEVIGITSMKLVEDEIEGMGFAIPIELVESILDKLENGKKIDTIRQQIERWKNDNLLLGNEYYILLASLIETVSFYANVAGVYAAFQKKWDPRAIKPFISKISFIIKFVLPSPSGKAFGGYSSPPMLSFMNSEVRKTKT